MLNGLVLGKLKAKLSEQQKTFVSKVLSPHLQRYKKHLKDISDIRLAIPTLPQSKRILGHSIEKILANFEAAANKSYTKWQANDVCVPAFSSGGLDEVVLDHFIHKFQEDEEKTKFAPSSFGKFIADSSKKLKVVGKQMKRATVLGKQMKLKLQGNAKEMLENPEKAEEFKAHFVESLAQELKIPADRIQVNSLEAGSIILGVTIGDSTKPNEPTANESVMNWIKAIIRKERTERGDLLSAVIDIKEVDVHPSHKLHRFEEIISTATMKKSDLEEELKKSGKHHWESFQACLDKAKAAKKRLPENDVRRGIDLHQLACVVMYTGLFYKVINKILRDLDLDKIRNYKHYMRQAIAAMYAMPYSPGRVYRRLSVKGDVKKRFPVGSDVQFPAWTSTSMSKDKWPGNVHFEISSESRSQHSHSKDVSWCSQYESEHEVLYLPYTSFTVTSITESEGKFLIGLDEKKTDTQVLLWVDDKPEGNKEVISMATDNAIRVVTKLTTKEALAFLDENPVLLTRDHQMFRIMTDVGRLEYTDSSKTEKKFFPDAGFDFLREVRKRNHDHLVLIYTSTKNLTKAAKIKSEKLGPAILCTEESMAKKFALFDSTGTNI